MKFDNQVVSNIWWGEKEVKGLAGKYGMTFSFEVIYLTHLQIHMTKPHCW